MAVKILSVDDELDMEVLLSQYFRRKIRKGEYEFYFAHNGIEALKILLEHKDIEIILSDINMPEMDGLTLLTKVNELQNPALKCIMVSAYGDMSNIRSAMNNGAFDFATKPIDLDDLSLTIEKAIAQIDFIKSSQEEHTQLESIKGDLAVAGEIQQAILPRIFPPFPDVEDKIDIYASMSPAKDVGGDFYDFFRIDDDRVGFVIADVSGKGVPAALFMAVSRTLFRAMGSLGEPTGDCVTKVNNMLCKESLDSMFVTVFYGIYNTQTGEIDYTNAGHNPPFLISDGTAKPLEMTDNLAVGIIEDFKYKNKKLCLNEGEALVLYTDGVTEAFNAEKEGFGEERVAAVTAAMAGRDSKDIVDAIKDSIQKFVENEPQSDDITLLVVKRN